jgi:hypothetical protein
MNEEGGFPILPFLIGALILAYFGIEVNRQRNKLRSIFNVVDRQESKIAAVLEQMVESGELKPYVPAPQA